MFYYATLQQTNLATLEDSSALEPRIGRVSIAASYCRPRQKETYYVGEAPIKRGKNERRNRLEEKKVQILSILFQKIRTLVTFKAFEFQRCIPFRRF